jgi:DNA-binding transcriptional MerR regulator
VKTQEWLSATEAGRRCGVSPATIHYWREKNLFTKLQERKSPTGRVVYEFPADEVDRMAKASQPVLVRA